MLRDVKGLEEGPPAALTEVDCGVAHKLVVEALEGNESLWESHLQFQCQVAVTIEAILENVSHILLRVVERKKAVARLADELIVIWLSVLCKRYLFEFCGNQDLTPRFGLVVIRDVPLHVHWYASRKALLVKPLKRGPEMKLSACQWVDFSILYFLSAVLQLHI